MKKKQFYTKYIKAVTKGMLKVMSKMGISTYQSYSGAQIFDAVGLSSNLLIDTFAARRQKLKVLT